MFGYDISYKQVIGYLILVYILVDTILFLFNGSKNTGTGGCATDKWIGGPFILNSSKKPPICEENVMDEGKLYSLSKWRAYALKNKKGEYNNF